MKSRDRTLFVVFFAAAAVFFLAGLYATYLELASDQKLLATSGLLLTVAGLFQIEASALFERIMEVYGDVEQYPYGPPSSIVRQIAEGPDTPVRTALKVTAFRNIKTGFWLIVAGTLIQVLAVWA